MSYISFVVVPLMLLIPITLSIIAITENMRRDNNRPRRPY